MVVGTPGRGMVLCRWRFPLSLFSALCLAWGFHLELSYSYGFTVLGSPMLDDPAGCRVPSCIPLNMESDVGKEGDLEFRIYAIK